MTKRIDLSPRTNTTEKTGPAEKVGIALFVLLIILPIVGLVSGTLTYWALRMWQMALALL